MGYIEMERTEPGNDASMSKYKNCFGVMLFDTDGSLCNGEKTYEDGTIVRYVNGFIDGNSYDIYGNIYYTRPAIEHKQGVEYWTKGYPQGFPAIVFDFGMYEEFWADRVLYKIKSKNELISMSIDDDDEDENEDYEDFFDDYDDNEDIYITFDDVLINHYLSMNVVMSFQDRLKSIMKAKKLRDPDVYKRIFMSEKIFNKVKNAKPETSVSYDNAVMIAFGLHLSFEQMVKFVSVAGKGFRNCGKREEIVREFFEDENYDIIELNETLEAAGEKPFLVPKEEN